MSDRPRLNPIVLDWYIAGLHKFTTSQHEVNLLDLLAATCGWNPLENGEKMTVHFDKKEYIVERIK